MDGLTSSKAARASGYSKGGGEATMKTRWSYDSDGELDSHRSRL